MYTLYCITRDDDDNEIEREKIATMTNREEADVVCNLLEDYLSEIYELSGHNDFYDVYGNIAYIMEDE